MHPDSAPAWFALVDLAAHTDNADSAFAAFTRDRALAPHDPATDHHVGARAALRALDEGAGGPPAR